MWVTYHMMSSGIISKISCDKVREANSFAMLHMMANLTEAGEVIFADVLLLPNGMSKVG